MKKPSNIEVGDILSILKGGEHEGSKPFQDITSMMKRDVERRVTIGDQYPFEKKPPLYEDSLPRVGSLFKDYGHKVGLQIGGPLYTNERPLFDKLGVQDYINRFDFDTLDADARLGANWLQSKNGASRRANISKDRAEFISKHVPLAVLLSLGDRIEVIRDAVTSLDVLRPDAEEELAARLKDIVRRTSYDAIKERTETPGTLGDEDRYVLAKIRADMMKGRDESDRIFTVFKQQVKQGRIDNIMRYLDVKPSSGNNNPLQDEAIIPINTKIISTMKNIVFDPRVKDAEEIIMGYRDEYRALGEESVARA